jgi:hypothetical protein
MSTQGRSCIGIRHPSWQKFPFQNCCGCCISLRNMKVVCGLDWYTDGIRWTLYLPDILFLFPSRFYFIRSYVLLPIRGPCFLYWLSSHNVQYRRTRIANFNEPAWGSVCLIYDGSWQMLADQVPAVLPTTSHSSLSTQCVAIVFCSLFSCVGVRQSTWYVGH